MKARIKKIWKFGQCGGQNTLRPKQTIWKWIFSCAVKVISSPASVVCGCCNITFFTYKLIFCHGNCLMEETIQGRNFMRKYGNCFHVGTKFIGDQIYWGSIKSDFSSNDLSWFMDQCILGWCWVSNSVQMFFSFNDFTWSKELLY